MLQDRTAGDPMLSDVRWTDLNEERIVDHLSEAGTPVSVPVVKQLLGDHDHVARGARRSQAMGSMPTATGSSRTSPGSSRSTWRRTTRS